MGTLDGKVALVTGSGRGIGLAIACKLASEGARLVVNDLDEGPARDTIARINDMGSQAVACVGDVTAADFGERFVNLAVETFGTPDIIVNNAGYTWDNVIQKMSDEQFQAVIDVHLAAPFRILRAAAGPIRAAAKQEAAEGRAVCRKVVNISSVSGGLRQCRTGKLLERQARGGRPHEDACEGVGPLPGHGERGRVRPRAHAADPGARGRERQCRHRGTGKSRSACTASVSKPSRRPCRSAGALPRRKRRAPSISSAFRSRTT